MIVKYFKLISLIICFLIIISTKIQAQDTTDYSHSLFILLQDNKPGEGIIQLIQDSELYVLVDKYTRINKREGINGYRIQIFSGSGQNGREQASLASQSFCKSFPDFDVKQIYMDYQAPYFKLCVGNFRNKNEANTFYHTVKLIFPDSYIVKSKISFPKLEPVDNQ
jgi:hypothetical protein